MRRMWLHRRSQRSGADVRLLGQLLHRRACSCAKCCRDRGNSSCRRSGLRNHLWAYRWLIALLLGFIGYQLYRITVHPSIGLIALTIFDALLVWLTWREYRAKRLHEQTHAPPGAPAADALSQLRA